MNVMDWAGTIGAIWLAVSILLGIAWALVGRRIFRKPPHPNDNMLRPPRILRDPDEIAAALDRDFGPKSGA